MYMNIKLQVHFSSWIDFFRGADTGILAWQHKKCPLRHKQICPQEICELAPLYYAYSSAIAHRNLKQNINGSLQR